MNKGIFLKRIFAWIVDLNIIFAPLLFIVVLLSFFIKEHSSITPIIIFLCFLLIVLAFVIFVLRDVIFKGRSLGKRLFELYIYEKGSLQQTTAKQRFLRNIFFIIYFIDGIILVATGETIGDRIAKTVVVSKQIFDSNRGEQAELICTEPVSANSKRKRIILTVAVIIVCLAGFAGLVQLTLNNKKDTEEYKVAYSYLIESDTFNDLNVDESKIKFKQYTLQSNSYEKTAEIGFTITSEVFKVVCHESNGVWRVCEDCTQFK